MRTWCYDVIFHVCYNLALIGRVLQWCKTLFMRWYPWGMLMPHDSKGYNSLTQRHQMLLQSHWKNFHYFNTIFKICLLLSNVKQDQIPFELSFILITYGAFQMCHLSQISFLISINGSYSPNVSWRAQLKSPEHPQNIFSTNTFKMFATWYGEILFLSFYLQHSLKNIGI